MVSLWRRRQRCDAPSLMRHRLRRSFSTASRKNTLDKKAKVAASLWVGWFMYAVAHPVPADDLPILPVPLEAEASQDRSTVGGLSGRKKRVGYNGSG